jgi:hypothetical protein
MLLLMPCYCCYCLAVAACCWCLAVAATALLLLLLCYCLVVAACCWCLAVAAAAFHAIYMLAAAIYMLLLLVLQGF